MSETRTNQLLDDFFAGTLDQPGHAELAALLEHDAAARARFDEVLRTEALLVAAHENAADKVQVARVTPTIGRPAVRRLKWLPLAAAAAAVLLLAISYAWYEGKDRGAILVESGHVQVKGVEQTRLREGDCLTVPSGVPARLLFPDGLHAEFSDATVTLVARVGTGRRTIKLDHGRGHFSVPKDIGGLDVAAPHCLVATLGTVFDVDVAAVSCAVSVENGRVRVDHAKRGHVVSAGEMRRFAEPGATPPLFATSVAGLRASVHGSVVKEFDGDAITLRVTQIIGVVRGNTAAQPRDIVNQIVRVAPGETDDDGLWHRVEKHEKFLSALHRNEELSLTLSHVSDDLFTLVDLPVGMGKHFDGQCGCNGQHQ